MVVIVHISADGQTMLAAAIDNNNDNYDVLELA
jgi:hypothetical protein